MEEIKNNVINTVIQLRNDISSAWATTEGQETPLMAGEVAVEIGEQGKAKIKIGDGTKAFGELDYFAPEAQVFQSENIAYGNTETDNEIISKLVAGKTISNGDCAIVKRQLSSGKDKYSYTSYVYTDGVWAAMDGNYSAANVYTNDNITLAGTYSTIGNFSKGKVVSAGTSLQSLLTEMLSQRIQPTITANPSATISVSGDDGGKEVGDTYTKPTATLTVTTGSYTNEGVNTGVKYLANNVTIAYGSSVGDATYKVSNSSDLGNNGTVQITATTYAAGNTSASYTDSSVSYTFSGKAHNEDGTVAVDNLGSPSNPEIQIKEGDLSVGGTKTASFRGYRKMFAGNTTATTLDSAAIRALSLKNAKASTSQFEITVPEGATNLVIACPTKSVGKKYTLSNVLMYSAGVWDDYTSKFETQPIVAVDGKVTGQDAQNYNVYMYKFAALKGDTKFKITLASANA